MTIKLCLASVVLVIASQPLLAQRLTTADPNYDELYKLSESLGWYQLSATKAWAAADNSVDLKTGARCMASLDKLRAAGVPDSRTLDLRYETPEFKPGVHTLAEIRVSCAHLERLGKIQAFEKWAILAMQAGTNVRSGSTYYPLCVKTYNEIVKAGVSPQDRVPERMIGDVAWSGSIQELKQKWCDAGMSAAGAATTAREEPFRKELSGDKLRLALKYGSFFMPGGAGTGDPKRMAAASVWFLDLSPPRHCADGRQVHTLRRYQFNASQKLVSNTEHDYCGGAPRSAFH